ncbi:MAG: AMP-binding protein, partial [Planctomycetaceae bacterium]|nr:AMP-binding protein [Planctomycetaceae bacterium]
MNVLPKPPWCGGAPDAVALEYHDRQLSYSELLARTQTVTGLLTKMFADREPGVVGIHIDDPLNLVIALLATLDSGATVVPIEATIPAERVRAIIDDTDMEFLLCDRVRKPGLDEALPGVRCIDCDDLIETDLSPGPIRPWHYLLLFTSGSTGRPKGVPFEARLMLREGEKTASLLRIQPHDRVSHALSPTLLSGL